MKFTIVLFVLLMMPGLCRAQQDEGEMDHSNVQVMGSTVSDAPQEHHTAEEEDELLHELEKAKAKQAETALKIQKTQEDFSNVGSGALSQLQKSGELNLEAIGKMDEKTIAFLQDKLKEAHMDRVPAEQVRAAILSKTDGKPLGQLFKRFPVLLDVSVDIVRDAEALPAFVGILGKKAQLKIYFYVWLGLFILSFLIKKYIFPKSWTGFKRFSASTFMSLLFLTISLTTFYQLFEKELSPIARVLNKHF